MKNIFSKTKLLLLLLVLAATNVNAQMTITEIKELPTQDARINYNKKDDNGELYAIIKIRSELPCRVLTFNFGSTLVPGGMVSMGECWVYAPAGATKLSITNTDTKSSSPYKDFPALKAGCDYELILAGGSGRVVIDETLNSGILVVECTIEGAEISIDKKEAELFTGKIFKKILDPGNHTLVVKAYGYESETANFTIIAEQTHEEKITLRSSMGEVSINSTPEQGATIYINDEMKPQTTPATIPLNKGKYTIKLVKKLYKPFIKKDVQISESETFLP
jgi:hypothetical protein